MPRLKRDDKHKRQENRPTEILAVAHVNEEATALGMRLGDYLRYCREISETLAARPLPVMKRVSQYAMKVALQTPDNIVQPLFAFDIARISESI